MEQLLELDLGDIIGVDGTAFCTRRGELIAAGELATSCWPSRCGRRPRSTTGSRTWRRASATARLDLVANEEVRELFITRARVVSAIRRFLDQAGFVEVETPVLQPLYGGALARPFTTHHNALDRTLYLRIATELYLKRLIVGGLERVYELGKDFRNEGVDSHPQP